MELFRNKNGDFYTIERSGEPNPIPPTEAWRLIQEEGYECINNYIQNNELIDIEKIKKILDIQEEEIELDEELTITRDLFFYGVDLVKEKFDNYFRWANGTKENIGGNTAVIDEPTFQPKEIDTLELVKLGLAYKVADNLYIFVYGSFYLYGHLVSNGSFWRFIGVKVDKKDEEKLLEIARTDFSVLNGVF